MRVGKRCIWVKSLNGKLRGLRLSRSRKFFSTMLYSTRIVRIYNDIVNKIMNMENSYPVIVLPTQWGLPVLSHPSVVCRRSVMVPPNRKVTFYQSFSIHSFLLNKLLCYCYGICMLWLLTFILFHSCYSLIGLAFIHFGKNYYASKRFITKFFASLMCNFFCNFIHKLVYFNVHTLISSVLLSMKLNI